MNPHAYRLNDMYQSALKVLCGPNPLPTTTDRLMATTETVDAYRVFVVTIPDRIERVMALQAIVDFQRTRTREILGTS